MSIEKSFELFRRHNRVYIWIFDFEFIDFKTIDKYITVASITITNGTRLIFGVAGALILS